MSAQRVSARELKAMLHDRGELALLDVREAGQFGESHLLFATPLPYSRLELDIGALVPRKSARIVLCDDGELGVAELAAKRLSALGYSDVRVLDGGTAGWKAAGYELFAGVNVPSKLFGELVEHEYGTPHVSVSELKRMQDAGEDVIVVDGRPYAEYSKMNIPGGICEFDLPAYHYWLHLTPAQQRQDLEQWLAPFLPVRDAVDIVLRLLRASGKSSMQVAQQGTYQQMMTGRVAQMVRIRLATSYPVVPETSANKYALNIRFMTQEGMQRPRAAETDVEFELTFCNL